jgi:hypothetical protein
MVHQELRLFGTSPVTHELSLDHGNRRLCSTYCIRHIPDEARHVRTSKSVDRWKVTITDHGTGLIKLLHLTSSRVQSFRDCHQAPLDNFPDDTSHSYGRAIQSRFGLLSL